MQLMEDQKEDTTLKPMTITAQEAEVEENCMELEEVLSTNDQEDNMEHIVTPGHAVRIVRFQATQRTNAISYMAILITMATQAKHLSLHPILIQEAS